MEAKKRLDTTIKIMVKGKEVFAHELTNDQANGLKMQVDAISLYLSHNYDIKIEPELKRLRDALIKVYDETGEEWSRQTVLDALCPTGWKPNEPAQS